MLYSTTFTTTYIIEIILIEKQLTSIKLDHLLRIKIGIGIWLTWSNQIVGGIISIKMTDVGYVLIK